MRVLLLTLLVYSQFLIISGSNGDRSIIFQDCLIHCLEQYCDQGPEGVVIKQIEPISKELWGTGLHWSCRDECNYLCMWGTVEEIDAPTNMPKFYGKWPFKRFLGVQEPAAAFSSFLNLAANAYMFRKIRREFPVGNMPLVLFWHVFAYVCMNAWVWSTIFHTRDKPFTEFMDYACALSMVMALFVGAIVRILHKDRELSTILLLFPIIYYVGHVQYLYTGQIDYDYNMKVNVLFGATGSLLWLGWSCFQYRAGRLYALDMILFTIASAAAFSLELTDFPPLWDIWDAHAMWHLSTAPLTLLFYRFVINDLRYLQLEQDKLV